MPSLDIANLQNLLKRVGSPWSAHANKITALDDAARARFLDVHSVNPVPVPFGLNNMYN